MSEAHVGMMPLRQNVPEPKDKGWKLQTCPRCGRECWKQGNLAAQAEAIYPDIVFLCTECALGIVTSGRYQEGAENGT